MAHGHQRARAGEPRGEFGDARRGSSGAIRAPKEHVHVPCRAEPVRLPLFFSPFFEGRSNKTRTRLEPAAAAARKMPSHALARRPRPTRRWRRGLNRRDRIARGPLNSPPASRSSFPGRHLNGAQAIQHRIVAYGGARLSPAPPKSKAPRNGGARDHQIVDGKELARPAGIEPATLGFGGRYSIH